MFKYLTSYFWGSSCDEQSLDNAYAVLNKLKRDERQENKFSNSNENVGISNKHVRKKGIITAIKNGSYIIDDIYKFECKFENLQIGTEIYFTCNIQNGVAEVSNISIVDEWRCNNEDEIRSCFRTFICKVNSRNGRLLSVIPGDININLDQVSSEFVPIIGDWLEVEAKVELDEGFTDLFGKILEIDAIRPLRPRILNGSIRTWCDATKTGSINTTVFFTDDAVSPGYIPIIGDKVVTEVIESDQGRYVCRSLKVIPENQAITKSKLLENNSAVAFESNVEGIFITDNININARALNEKHPFSVQITNNLTQDLTLLSIALPVSNFQCKIIQPTLLTSIAVKANETINLDCLCTVKCVGITKELIIFSFENFTIGRWVTVNVKFNLNSNTNSGNYIRPHPSKGHFKKNNKDVIRGQTISLQPRFSCRLPSYHIPEKLLALFHKCTNNEDMNKLIEELPLIRPCLSMPVTFNIYEDRFHALLHLTEIDEIVALQNYRQDETCLIKNGEFLMLEIENLAEKRPSLICGDQIIVKNSRDCEADEYEGIIHKIGSKHVYIKFSPTFHNNYKGELVTVMAISSRAKFRRMHQAVGLVIRNLGKPFLFPSKLVMKNPQINFTFNDDLDAQTFDIVQNECAKQQQINTTLKSLKSNKERQICHNTSNSSALPSVTATSSNVVNKICNSESSKHISNDISKNKNENFVETSNSTLKLEWYNKNLNFYQKEAIRNILIGEARPLPYIIFGPPGTGKTVTLVEVVLQLIRLIPHSRLLIATPSNSAADLMATRLIDSGVLNPGDLIRLVAYHIVTEDAIPVHLIPYSAVADIARQGTGIQSCDVKNNKLTIGYNSSVIGRHRITIGTCSALGVLFGMGFPKGHFTHIIVDEAGQLMEPEIMIPLSFLDTSSGQAILAGDPLQLGPVIMSVAAKLYGLEETYMDRMINRFPYARDVAAFPNTEGYDPRLITRLLYNYRSLPLVLNLFNKLFYGGQLISTISSTDSYEAYLLNSVREILPCQEMNVPPSIVFHGLLGENYQTLDSPSWFNPDEASQIFFYVNELYRLGLKSSDIGIISPYMKQIKQIRSLLVEAEFQVPKIGTVEEFQGQEFNVILLSTVRSSYNLVEQDFKYKLGFISNPRRVNVAISRAKILLIIVGNPYLLSKDVLWRSILSHCVENKSYCGCDLEKEC